MNEKAPQPRTAQQNRAMHLLFRQLADMLNAYGLDMRTFPFKEGVEIPWSDKTIKDYLWRPIQQAQLQKQSTTELTTKEIDEVFATLQRHLIQATGLTDIPPFPSIEEVIARQRKLTRKPKA